MKNDDNYTPSEDLRLRKLRRHLREVADQIADRHFKARNSLLPREERDEARTGVDYLAVELREILAEIERTA